MKINKDGPERGVLQYSTAERAARDEGRRPGQTEQQRVEPSRGGEWGMRHTGTAPPRMRHASAALSKYTPQQPPPFSPSHTARTHAPVDWGVGPDVAAAERAHLLQVHHDEVILHVAAQRLAQLIHQLLVQALRPAPAVPLALHARVWPSVCLAVRWHA